jgi:protein SCO1
MPPNSSYRLPPPPRPWRLRWAGLAVCAAALALAGCGHRQAAAWQLTDISGHLPDLQFSLTGDTGQPVDANAVKGQIALLYFGYTHCPDTCPETMARLAQALNLLGPAAARHVRILFISIDPARDTPAILHAYVDAFDAAHAEGLTGSPRQIEVLARRYRVAYRIDSQNTHGDYEIAHSSAVYIFDANGQARLLATAQDSAPALAADLRRLIASAWPGTPGTSGTPAG